MLQNNILRLLSVFCIVILFSCSSNSVKLDATNAKDEVPVLGNLYFRFNKSVVPDSLLNNWEAADYISFTPSIKGKFRWQNTDELVFSPEEPLLPATTYKAVINRSVLQFSRFDRIQTNALSFSTPSLTLDDAFSGWMLNQNNAPTAKVQLYFNYPVDVEQLKNNIKVTIDGNNKNFSMLQTGSSSSVALQIEGLKAEDRSYEMNVIIDKKMLPKKGKNGMKENINSSLLLTSPYILSITNVETEHIGNEGIIKLYTSQQITGNATPFIQFDPALSFNVDYYENYIALRSEKFEADKSYSFTVSSGLKGTVGGTLKDAYYGSAAFGELEPSISFTNKKAIYLSKAGSGNIEVNITNTPKIKVVVSKIYENNLIQAQRNGYSPADNDGLINNTDYNYGENYYNDFAGDIIYTKTIETRSLPKSGNGRILNLSNIQDQLSDFKGIYHVMVRSENSYWISDSRFISLSDIGLIAKQSDEKVLVFANSLKTTKALSGVTINVYGKNNQLIGTGATKEDGAVEIGLKNRGVSGFMPYMIVAKTANDFSYLPLPSTLVNTSRFDVGGKRINNSALDAYIYAERDIYRPGEKINFSAVIRNLQWKSPGELPVKFTLLMPNGKELKSIRKTLNEQGSTDGSFDIATAAITGTYTLELYSSNDILLSTKNFMIEEFVPDRLKLSAKLDQQLLTPGLTTQLKINAINFFGPPAADRKYEVEIQVKHQQFVSKKYKEYNFSLANQTGFFDKTVMEGKTDKEGNANIAYTIPTIYANNGLLQAGFYTTVFDETGRPVSKHIKASVVTQQQFIGIKEEGIYYYSLNKPVNIALAAVNNNDDAVNTTAQIKVIKYEYRTVMTSAGGSLFRYESQKETKIIKDQTINVGANTNYSFIPTVPGEYEVRIYRSGSNAYTAKSFYSYGPWGSNNNSFEVNTEGQIDIETDKENYNCGDKVKLLFKAPFSGRMLVTVENDHVITYKYVDVVKKTASLDIDLNAGHLPNVYISATLFKPHEISDIPLTVAHGYKNVSVKEKERKINVTISAQETSRSHSHQKVKVTATPGSYITLSAVDNGVLQVTDFKSPDPYDYFYQKRALTVKGFDVYPLLFPEIRTRMSSTGGDGELNMDKRVNPMQAKRFKLMSYWSGINKTDGSGNATFEFDVPQFNGQIRLMAVAYKDEKFGGADKTITIADPLVISSALPRFITSGDTVSIPITLSNTTNKNINGNISIAATGPVQIMGNNTNPISILANNEARIVFNIGTRAALGVANIKITATASGETYKEETEISVRPPSTLQKSSGSGQIAANTATTITIPKSDYIESSFNYDLVISRSPIGEIADQIKYLVQYPYGCTEQTISSAFPQLYYSDMAEMLGLKENKNASYNIMEAIRKIKTRQLYNGGLTLWEGEGTENWWSTVYAAHFLIEARKAGYDIDSGLLENILSYINNKLRRSNTIEYYYNGTQKRKIAPKEVPYSLYVLALAGRSNASSMNYYRANSQMLALDGKYLLSAAYAIAGDKKAFASLLPASFSGEISVKQSDGSFYSNLRDESLALNALLEVDPGNKQIPFMAKHVKDILKTERFPNTQERAFSLLALGKIARANAGSTTTGIVKVNGKTVGNINTIWKGSRTLLKSDKIEIETKGNAPLYYTWIAEGISESGKYKEEDQFIKINRKFYDRYGKPISSTTLKQNELLIVELTLDKIFSTPIGNIVITDLLPAGFEIENARTKEIPGMDWIKNANEPTAIDVRDDRIHFFVDAFSAKQKYYYAIRTVSTGKFKLGPVSADAMYNGEIHSYHGAQTIKIIP